MAIKFVSMKCPECGALLDIEEGRRQCYCSYCGAKVMVQNENEYIFRHIDEAEIKHAEAEIKQAEAEIKQAEAEIKQAETEKLIRLKELERKKAKDKHGRKDLIIGLVVAFAFVIIGVVCLASGELIGVYFLLAGLLTAGLFIYNDSEARKKRNHEARMISSGKIKLTGAASNYDKKSYPAVEAVYKSLGFKNIRSVNMRDLRMGLLKKHGIVAEVTIGGKTPSAGKWYDPNATVVIAYHGLDKT